MTISELASAVLEAPRLRELSSLLARTSVLGDFGAAVEAGQVLPAVPWGEALTFASALTGVDDERAQDAVLRVAQGCLASDDAETHHRNAAAVLLERLGNRPGLQLAVDRGYVSKDAWTEAPPAAQLDVVRRRLELGIPLSEGDSLGGNPFQRQFWSAAQTADWVSVSAPTSAGKSFIVKRWFREQIATRQTFRGVYLVPTRALIEEVGSDLRREFPESVGIHAFPWDSDIGTLAHEIHVLTQERLHLLQQLRPDVNLDMLFIDEAQKFGDGRRGILLQQVLFEAARRAPEAQVLFASPLTLNPEILLDGAPAGSRSPTSIQSKTVTVNQNLLWANQVPGKPQRWALDLVLDGEPAPVGQFDLPARATQTSKRLPYVALALGGAAGGNVVYVNGAAAAEKAAAQIFDALGPGADIADNEDVIALRDLVRKTIHSRYTLEAVLARGVAFHYGNMPLLVRNEVERLFRIGVVQYLICTSTLLEGVNLPCRNLFVLNPMKGNGNPMSGPDFWNLAGRAGRWGMEFQGNIVCVDTTKPHAWKAEIPRRRERKPLVRATDSVLTTPEALRDYIRAEAPLEVADETPLLEAVFSFLSARVAGGADLADLPHLDPNEAAGLTSDIRAILDRCDIPDAFITRHNGIGPAAQQRLLDYFRNHPDLDSLLLPPPESDDAADRYAYALQACNDHLASAFTSPLWRARIALLLVSWMRGLPLAHIIQKRLDYLARHGKEIKLAKEIRDVMQDIEKTVRFVAPKYLACYADLLAHHLIQLGRYEEAASMPDISMMLELGVSSQTQVSLMAMGLSRTSAVALSELIADDELSRDQCLAWIQARDLESSDLPSLVLAEVQRSLAGQK